MEKFALPLELESYREIIEKSISPFVKINTKKEKKLSIWQSKSGDYLYLPKNVPYPKDSEGNMLAPFLQINFEELPPIKPFPKKGILTFYITSPHAKRGLYYGGDSQRSTKQDGWRILYFPKIIKNIKELTTDFSFLPKDILTHLSFEQPTAFSFVLDYAPVSAVDFRFQQLLGKDFFDLVENLNQKKQTELYINYQKMAKSKFRNKIGGYAFPAQNDPREISKYKNYTTLLLQIKDDNFMLNFYIDSIKLAKGEFADVLFEPSCD